MTPTFLDRPKAYIDYTTKNTSFLAMSDYLKSVDIVNNEFMLMLYDRSLIGVDPHALDPERDRETIIRCMEEARCNGWYFLREVLRIPKVGADVELFGLNRGACAMAWCFFNGIDYIGLLPRQSGNSTTVSALLTWVLYASGRSTRISQVAKDYTIGETATKRIQSFTKALPSYWISLDTFKDKNNAEEIYYHCFQNHFNTMVGQHDPRKADLQARAANAEIIAFEDFGYISNIHNTYPTMGAATHADRSRAIGRGSVASWLMTTTMPHGENKEAKFTRSFLNKAMPFTDQFYDFSDVHTFKSTLRLISPTQVVKGVFTPTDLGRSWEWINHVVNRSGLSLQKVLSEYFNVM